MEDQKNLMFDNNFYILYPPGYFGTYINWLLNKSNIRNTGIIDNPLNGEPSNQFGGEATCHKFVKTPTHMACVRLLAWRVMNPGPNQVFSINTGRPIGDDNSLPFYFYENSLDKSLTYLHFADRNPVFINVFVQPNSDEMLLGNILQILKWPTWWEAMYLLKEKVQQDYPEFNPYDCNTLQARNVFVKHYEWMFRTNYQMSTYDFDRSSRRVNNWYNVRNTNQPHEINSDQFVTKFDAAIIEVSLTDILSDNFVALFKEKLQEANVNVSYFDFSYVTEFHLTFVQAQKHKQWLLDVNKLLETGEYSEYLDSHAIIQASTIIRCLNFNLSKLPSGWELMNTEDLVKKIL